MKNLLKAIRDLICGLGLHKFRYYSENYNITGFRRINNMNIKIRKCECCDFKQAHTMPLCNGIAFNWKSWNRSEGDTLRVKQIN